MDNTCYHFCAVKNGKPLLRDGSPALDVGETETYEGRLRLCKSGLHMSRRAIDALYYAPGAWCRIVRYHGEIKEESDKLVSNKREILHSFDATNLLHEFACICAETALLIAGVEDSRSWEAIEAKRAWLRGEISDSQLDAARDAAWAVTWAAARNAARNAARGAVDAAARDAADAAAGADAAALAAARDAARDEQNEVLESMLWEVV